MASARVTYAETGAALDVPLGTRLLDVLLRLNPDHRHVCGGNGYCTSCRVSLEAGELSLPSRVERERLGSRCGSLRLACQSYVEGDVTVRPAAHGSLIDWE